MTRIALECVSNGANLIGHIKSVTDTNGKGFLACSVVEPSGAVQTKGKLEDGIEEFDVVLNVLLYGLEKEKVAEIAKTMARKEMSFNGARIEIEDLEKEHDHEHDHGH